jgi:hypothetical protein
VTQIESGGTIKRRMVDTAARGDALQWEELAERALAVPLPYRPAPGGVIYHLRVGERDLMVAEHDLAGTLRDLVTAVMTLGDAVLATGAKHRSRSCTQRRYRLVLLCLLAAGATPGRPFNDPRRRLCRSGPGPRPVAASCLLGACIAGYGVRLPCGHPNAIPRRLHARCMRCRLPPRGGSPLGWTSTCRWCRPAVAGHSKMTASCASRLVAAGSQAAPSGGQAARPASALARRPGGGEPARGVTGWPLMGTGRVSWRRRRWFRRAAQPARLRCPRWCGCRRRCG